MMSVVFYRLMPGSDCYEFALVLLCSLIRNQRFFKKNTESLLSILECQNSVFFFFNISDILFFRNLSKQYDQIQY